MLNENLPVWEQKQYDIAEMEKMLEHPFLGEEKTLIVKKCL